jgi:hypothetical protein
MEKHFTYDAAFKGEVILCNDKLGKCAAGGTASEACVQHWQSIKTKMFSCLTNRKSFSEPKKEGNPVLQYFKDLPNKGLPVTRKAKKQ